MPEIELTSNTTIWNPSRFDTVSQDRFVTVEDDVPTIRVGNDVSAVVNEALHASDNNIPSNREQALQIDGDNGNTRWSDAMDDAVERIKVSQGYDGLSCNYHPDQMNFIGHYCCSIDDHQ